MEGHCYDTMCLFFQAYQKNGPADHFLLGEQRRFSKEGEEIK